MKVPISIGGTANAAVKKLFIQNLKLKLGRLTFLNLYLMSKNSRFIVRSVTYHQSNKIAGNNR